ncbi:hypothetical protein GM658_00460 [Pseudoduganella eburnea]|uniref:Uracil-DNA glycosylase-like domain-containing protein n=1 Tax=Massilia eburnea TaxID=1776165 RepID=A0A6L6QAF4_9BURK|nr:uracil-DNA glycosylase family protein [Massilia eburnea]MTW09059.1 hypothetical protein [Massilia eburnea]
MSDRRNAVFLDEMGVGPQWRLRNRPASASAGAYAYADVDVDTGVPAGYAASPEAGPGSAPQQAATPQSAAQHPGAQPAADAQRMANAQPAQGAAHYEPTAPSPASATATHQSPAAAAARAASAAPVGLADARQVPPTAATAPGRAGDARQAPPAAATAHGHADDVRQAPAAPNAPAAPTRVPGTPSIASTGEDMSWFDDAPTPEYKPQRKKVAAPEQPAAAQPQRPAPAAQAMQPAGPAMPPRAASAPPPAMADDVPAFDDIPMDEPPSWFDDEQQAAPVTARRDAPAPGGGEPASHVPGPRPGRVTDEEIAQMDWPALQAAVSSCTRCARCETRQQAVPGRGDGKATWIALDTAPGQAEDAEGYQFAGDPGYLLDNMLKAVGQTTEKGAYLTSLVKCHAPSAPSAEELQACRPYLQRELELTQAKVIVAFGHTTGKGLLGGAARGRIMLHGEIPVVATYHPADLLKKPEEKAKAWQDLCLAKAAHAGRR